MLYNYVSIRKIYCLISKTKTVAGSLTDKDLRIISILKSGKKMSVGEIKAILEREGREIPYTTVSSALEKLYRKGILKREEVKSRGKYGKKNLYYLDELADSSDPIAEILDIIFSGYLDAIHSNNAIAFIDKRGVITFLYGNDHFINDKNVIGKRVEELHSKVTAKFVRKIFEELKNKRREFFKRTVNFEGKTYEKYYYGIWSSDNEFLGVLVITRFVDERKNIPLEALYP